MKLSFLDGILWIENGVFRGMASLNISKQKLIVILKLLPNIDYESIEDIAVFLYDEKIFTYKRRGIRRTQKSTIKSYLLSMRDLDIIKSNGQLTTHGKKLIENLEDEHLFNKGLAEILLQRSDVNEILRFINSTEIPTKEMLSSQINIPFQKSSLLINLLADCSIILRNRKTTYFPITLDRIILDIVQHSKTSLTLDNLERDLKERGYSGTAIQSEIIRLVVMGKLEISERINDSGIQLLDLVVQYLGEISPPVTVKLDKKFYNFLDVNGVEKPAEYVDSIVEDNPRYLSYAPLTSKSHKGLLVFNRLGMTSASLSIN